MIMVEAADLTKEFGGLVAVDGVSFNVFSGQIKALIGPNGAGKTTIFNLLSGFEKPTKGRIKFKDKSIVGLKPHQIAALGMGRTFQNTQLFEELTVLENVKIGCHLNGKTEIWRAMFHFPPIKGEEDYLQERAEHYVKLVNLEEKSSFLAGDLPQGERRLLEIARALAGEPELLLLDEPAAGITTRQRGWLRLSTR